jgi:hypothetical protein
MPAGKTAAMVFAVVLVPAVTTALAAARRVALT